MIAAIKERFIQLHRWADALSVRERGILFIGIMLSLLFLSVNLVFYPQHEKQARLEKEFKSKLAQVQFFEKQIQQLIDESHKDPDQENSAKLAKLKAQLQKLDSSLVKVTTGLVTPREMARLVEEVLAKNRRLSVVKVESLPPAPLVESENEPGIDPVTAKPVVSEQLMYKHGMYIELTGQYLDILKYLQTLEGMKWKVFWGRVTLSSEKYPVSRLTLVLYTLSLHEGWIGV